MAEATETVVLVQRQDYQFEMQFGGAGIPIAVQVFDASGAQLK